MSQYPSPYLPPTYSPDPGYLPQAAELLAPARKAAVALFVLGAFGLACGMCVGTAVWMVPGEQLERVFAQSGISVPDLSGTGMSVSRFLRVIYSAAGAASAAVGIILVVIGLLVRRGGRASAITGIVFTSLILLWLALQVLGVIGLAAQGNFAVGAATLFVIALPAMLIVMAVSWLAKAARNAPQIAQQQLQLQAQYWQMQQQQTAYGQGGYGYGVPPPPPAGSPPALPTQPERAGAGDAPKQE